MPDHYGASPQTIGALLSTTSPRIEVPDWQRSYSWKTEEIDEFWLDLIAFDRQHPGENITGEEYFLGSIVLVTGGSTSLLLDGQQRLATATILLGVLRDERKLYSGDSAVRLQNKYISDYDDATGRTSHVLTLNVYDRDFFTAEIQDDPTTIRPVPMLRSHLLIRKAREYFEAHIKEENDRVGGGRPAFERNLRIGQILCDHMSVVSVTSTDEDSAASVFETLNDRGIGLSTPDLLRNFLLRRSPPDSTRDRIVAAWQSVLEIGEEVSVEEFLRHYWVSHRGDVRTRKLYREIKDTIIDEGRDPLRFSLDLAAAAPVYLDFIRARDPDPELRRLLEGIGALDAKALYPALLSGHAAIGEADQEKLRDLARALTNLYVRHNVVGGRETTRLESMVYGVAADLRQTGDFQAAQSSLAGFAPDADDFISRFQRVSVSRIATARYLLREIEHAKRRTAEVAVEGTDRVHVEHIYPQTPEAGSKWAAHPQYLNRLGNLTLLGKRLNTSIRNSPFSRKKQAAYADSDILMTRELLEYDSWGPESVERRQRELSNWAFDIWKFPGEQPPSELTETEHRAESSDLMDLTELPEVPG